MLQNDDIQDLINTYTLKGKKSASTPSIQAQATIPQEDIDALVNEYVPAKKKQSDASTLAGAYPSENTKKNSTPNPLPPTKQPFSGFKNLAAEAGAGAELPLEMKVLPGYLKALPIAARMAAGAYDAYKQGGGVGDIIGSTIPSIGNPKYSLTNLASGDRIDTSKPGASDIGASLLGMALGSGAIEAAPALVKSLPLAAKTLAAKTLTSLPGYAGAAALGIPGQMAGEKLADVLVDKDKNPQTSAAAKGLLGGLGAATGGMTGEAGVQGVGKLLPRLPDWIKSSTEGIMPTSNEVSVAKQYSDVLSSDPAQTLMNGVDTPNAENPVVTLDTLDKVKPRARLNQDTGEWEQVNSSEQPLTLQQKATQLLGATPKSTTPEQYAQMQKSAWNQSQDIVKSVDNLKNQYYNHARDVLGDQPITFNPDTAEQILDSINVKRQNVKMSDFADLDKHLEGLSKQEDSIETAGLKQSVQYVLDRVFRPLFDTPSAANPKAGEEAPERLFPAVKFDDVQTLLNQINSLLSLNTRDMPTQHKNRLYALKDFIKESTRNSIRQADPANADYNVNMYNNADKLQNELFEAKEASKVLDANPEHGDLVKKQDNALGMLGEGHPLANLNQLVRTSVDVAGADHPQVQDMAAKLGGLTNSIQQAAFAKGGDAPSKLIEGFENRHAYLNDPKNNLNVTTSPSIVKFNKPLELGQIKDIQDNYIDQKSGFKDKDFVEDLFSNNRDKAARAHGVLETLKDTNKEGQFTPLLNDMVNNHIANFFEQGENKGNYNSSKMNNALEQMSQLYRNFNDRDTGTMLSKDTRTTLSNANEIHTALQNGAINDPGLKNLISKFDEKSPNAATQAAKIMQSLHEVNENINNRQTGLKPRRLYPDEARVVMSGWAKPIWKVLKLFTPKPNIEEQQAALGNIKENISTERGRQKLAPTYQKSQEILQNNPSFLSRVPSGILPALNAIQGNRPSMTPKATQSPITDEYVDPDKDVQAALERLYKR